MSYTSGNISHILNSLNGTSPTAIPITPPVNGFSGTVLSNYKIIPTFRMELYKSENSGFILNLLTMDNSTFIEKGKLFILPDVENMGRDIQNILAMEILKT